MVGVPGRSRACQPCKKRRVACDTQQPECARCMKAKRTCEYGNSRIFVVNDQGSHKTKYRKEDGEVATANDRSSQHVSNQRANNEAPEQSLDHLWSVATQALLMFRPPANGLVNQQALLAHALDGAGVYTAPTLTVLTYSVSNSVESSCVRATFLACYPLPPEAPPSAFCRTIANYILFPFSIGWLGRREHNKRLIDAGRQFYVQGLKDTHSALAVTESAYADSTLAACTALSIYEALECPDGTKSAYNWHRAACYRLIQMRGPAAHQDGAGHHLFAGFRFFGILHAFDYGHCTFLSAPEWTDIPFSIHAKSKFDELVDIFALGPDATELGNSLATLPPDQVLPAALILVKKLSTIWLKLDDFYQSLENAYPGEHLYWERVSPTRDDFDAGKSEFAFPPSLWFLSLDVSSIMMLYWAILAMVWSGLTDLYSLFAEYGVAHLLSTAMGEASDFSAESAQLICIDRARKVLQSLAYCTTPQAVEAGPPRGIAQLAIVTDVLKRRTGCAAEYRWAVKMRKRIANRWLKLVDAKDI